MAPAHPFPQYIMHPHVSYPSERHYADYESTKLRKRFESKQR